MSYLVVKIGGAVALDAHLTAALIVELATRPERTILVHGGGKAVNEMSRRLGIEPHFVDGIRITGEEEMAVVDMVLAGRVNTELVRLAGRHGVSAIGMTGADGGLLCGRRITGARTTPALHSAAATSRTAVPYSVRLDALKAVRDAGFLPIVASVGIAEEDGEAVNINADDAAQAITEALSGAGEATTLCFLSDIPGVLDESGDTIGTVEGEAIERLIADGVARDGMAAKLRACRSALSAGVGRIAIGNYGDAGDLEALLSGRRGTSIVAVAGRIAKDGADGSSD